MDLVERLRKFDISDALGDGDFSVCSEAADRIEALENALEAIKELCDTEDDMLLIWQTARDALAVKTVE